MEAPLRRRSTLENGITAMLLVGITPPLPLSWLAGTSAIEPVSAGRERLLMGRQITRDRWFVSRAPAPLPSADSAKLRTDARRIAYVSKVRANATDPIALAVSCAAGEVPFRTVPNVDPYRG